MNNNDTVVEFSDAEVPICGGDGNAESQEQSKIALSKTLSDDETMSGSINDTNYSPDTPLMFPRTTSSASTTTAQATQATTGPLTTPSFPPTAATSSTIVGDSSTIEKDDDYDKNHLDDNDVPDIDDPNYDHSELLLQMQQQQLDQGDFDNDFDDLNEFTDNALTMDGSSNGSGSDDDDDDHEDENDDENEPDRKSNTNESNVIRSTRAAAFGRDENIVDDAVFEPKIAIDAPVNEENTSKSSTRLSIQVPSDTNTRTTFGSPDRKVNVSFDSTLRSTPPTSPSGTLSSNMATTTGTISVNQSISYNSLRLFHRRQPSVITEKNNSTVGDGDEDDNDEVLEQEESMKYSGMEVLKRIKSSQHDLFLQDTSFQSSAIDDTSTNQNTASTDASAEVTNTYTIDSNTNVVHKSGNITGRSDGAHAENSAHSINDNHREKQHQGNAQYTSVSGVVPQPSPSRSSVPTQPTKQDDENVKKITAGLLPTSLTSLYDETFRNKNKDVDTVFHPIHQIFVPYYATTYHLNKISAAIRLPNYDSIAAVSWISFWALLLVTCANHILTPMRDAIALHVGVKNIPNLTLASTVLALFSSVPIGWLFEAPDPSRRKLWKRIGLTRGETQGTSLALFYRLFAFVLLSYSIGFSVLDFIVLHHNSNSGNDIQPQGERRTEEQSLLSATSISSILSIIDKALHIAFFLIVHLMKLHCLSLVWGVVTEALEYEEESRSTTNLTTSNNEPSNRNERDNSAALPESQNSSGGSSQKMRLKRLSFIGFGGTVGGILGSIIASTLAGSLKLPGLLVLSASLLEVCAQLSIELGRIMQKHWIDQRTLFLQKTDQQSDDNRQHANANSLSSNAGIGVGTDGVSLNSTNCDDNTTGGGCSNDGNLSRSSSSSNIHPSSGPEPLDSSMKRSLSLGSMKRVASGNSLHRVNSGTSLNRVRSTSDVGCAPLNAGSVLGVSDSTLNTGSTIRQRHVGGDSHWARNNQFGNQQHNLPQNEAAPAEEDDVNDSSFRQRLMRGVYTIFRSRLLMAIFTYNAMYASTTVLLSFQRAALVASRNQNNDSASGASVQADTAFLANINMASSLAIFALQASGLGAYVAHACGSRGTLSLMPLIRLLGVLALAYWHHISNGEPPNLLAFLIVDEFCKIMNLAIAKPVRESLWRGLSNEARYEAKPIVDTLANRWGGGSAAFLAAFVDKMVYTFKNIDNTDVDTSSSKIDRQTDILGFPPVLFLCIIISAWWAVVSADLGQIRKNIDIELKKRQ